MQLTKKISVLNYNLFIWHATFLALATNFIDVGTIIPAMLIDAGGSSMHIGFMTAIMLGVSKVTQLIFAPFLQNRNKKKGYLLLGINLRIFSLACLALLFVYSLVLKSSFIILIIFLLITIFSVSGSFANISYVDILGKSVLESKRKSFFSMKQIVSSIGVLISAYFARKMLIAYSYPANYALLFFIAAFSLLIASLAFWHLKEIKAGGMKLFGIINFAKTIIKEVRNNKNLANYLIIINTLGISITLLPFLVSYAKEILYAGNEEIGNYLIFKVIGSVIIGAVLFYFSKKVSYKNMFYLIIILSVMIPVLLVLLPAPWYFILFFIGGIIFALTQIANSGVLLEVSSNHNRALYTGITGAGGIIPTLFSILGGWIIGQFGYTSFFILFITIIITSLYFVYHLNCKK